MRFVTKIHGVKESIQKKTFGQKAFIIEQT